ncbi:MAG: hypothetical protein IT536_05595 [Hyphomicrobiales bacterium]|nr:hypothetical protein [Hyphomicrobiales bacterium]
MRKLFLSIAAAAALMVTGSLANRAEAFTIGSPAGMQHAIEELSTIEPVHCRPGWRHHRPTQWRRANGCLRRGVVVVPGRWHLRGHSWRGHRWHRWHHRHGPRRWR